MAELTELSLLEAADALQAGRVSSLDLTRACLDRIAAEDPSLHAFLAVSPASAEAQAAAADRRLAQARRDGETLPTVMGIPIAVKDVLCVEGLPATAGSRILEGFRPPYSATSVARLTAAGAVVLGKTNTDEFAMGSSTENSAYGVTRNPWALDRVPGGSSGGSAAAIAARLAYAALGTDTGGSVRQPASFCGVTGLKPTYGRVSRYGLIAYGSSLDTVGALARSAADLVPLFEIMSGHDPLDSTSLSAPPLQSDPDVRWSGVRVGVPSEYFIKGIQPEVEDAVRRAVETFRSLGAHVEEVSLPHTDLALPVYYVIAPAEASANLARYDGIRYGPRAKAAGEAGAQSASPPPILEQYLETRGQFFGPEVKRRIMLGTYALSAGYYDAYYGQAQRVRTLIRQDFESAFRRVDVLACPVAPTTAFPIGGHGDDPLSMYLEDVFTLPANLAGIPGLAFPVGFDSAGLPIGIQLNGPPLSEGLLLRLGEAYQDETDWHRRHPGAPGQHRGAQEEAR
ncbi:MAG TPA: Asp-tRNA(Asn)/Glu-tRNA(Gln) amidotransferase subunit GatA [Anaerolineales bacterium]|nr:Asp-tRNA(Asn)/Glu-tRNA(Gln) amidotransferase subunit GatA [Anaerolineales bacterium]